MSIDSYPNEMLDDLFCVTSGNDDHFPTVKLISAHFRKCKKYASVVDHILSVISGTIIDSKEKYGRDDELFDVYINMQDTKSKNMDLGFMRSLVKILVKMFPGKLRKCEIYNAPKFFPPVYKLLSPLIPKNTRDRVYFN